MNPPTNVRRRLVRTTVAAVAYGLLLVALDVPATPVALALIFTVGVLIGAVVAVVDDRISS